MQNLDIQTDVTQVFHASCTDSTDVRVGQQWLAANTYGQTSCAKLQDDAPYYCDRWRVRINFEEIQNDASNVTNQVRKTACHEIGHTVGVDHYDAYPNYAPSPDGAGNHSCMRSGIWDSGALAYRTLGPHHIGHVNAWF